MTREDNNGACMFVLGSLRMGGSERKTVRIANQLVKRGREVHLAFLDKGLDIEESLSSGVNVIFLDRHKKCDMVIADKLRRYVLDNNITRLWSVNLYPCVYRRS